MEFTFINYLLLLTLVNQIFYIIYVQFDEEIILKRATTKSGETLRSRDIMKWVNSIV